MEAAEYIKSKEFQNARCVIVSLDAENLVTDVEIPWAEWPDAPFEIGGLLPEPMRAVLDATPHQVDTNYYPFVYVDDSLVVDVHVLTRGPLRQLVLRDVSEVHLAELKFQQKAHEVSLLLEKQSELNHQLELQRAELERANQAKSRFIASMSHEFRSPITSIMGHADMLAGQMDDSSLPAAIQRASWHLLALVENLLEQARQGEGMVNLYPSSVDLEGVLADMRDLFTIQARAKGLELVIVAPSECLRVSLDELRLRQVLINLLSNAIRFTQRGRVELAASCTPETLTFQVRDTGPGISEEDQALIFKPFMRLDPDRETGAGLGLSITQQLIEAMGGELRLDSELDQGSTFSFSLPKNKVSEPEPQVDLPGLEVLLVDDDADVLAIYELFLEDWGMHVHCSTGLPEALAMLGQRSYDLVIADLHLEDASGIDLLKAVRAKQEDCGTILCSGSGISSDWKERFGEYADEFLMKPVRPDRMKDAINRILGQKR